MPFDPDERCDANGRRDANTGADTDASTAHDRVDEQAEQLVRDAFAALPVVPCPDDVVRRIEQAVTETESPLGAGTMTTGRHRTWVRWLPTVGSVAAAAAIAWLLFAQPTNRTEPIVRQGDGDATSVGIAAGNVDANNVDAGNEGAIYTDAGSNDVGDNSAAREVRQGLALATQMLQRSEQILLEEAFVKPLPGAVRNSLRKTVSLVQGGWG